MSNFIVTHTPYFKKQVLNELGLIDDNVKVVKKFDDSIMLIETMMEEKKFIDALRSSKPIFIKHICPASHKIAIVGELDKDKKTILESVLNENIVVLENEKFAIQCRIVCGGLPQNKFEYSSKDIEVFVGTYFTNIGGIPTFSDRNIVNAGDIKIISIFINEFDVYFGVSTSCDNLNFSCDEFRIASKAGGREISRAENKLKEALVNII